MSPLQESAVPPASDPEALAAWLAAQHEAGNPFAPYAAAAGLSSLEEAYRVQDALVAQRITPPAAGWKIALTNPRMQSLLGVGAPVSGVLAAAALQPDGARVRPGAFGRLGVECEICLGLGRSLPADPRPRSVETIAAHVAWAAPAFELVDDRKADYALVDAVSLVAENAWNAGVVLGERTSVSGMLEDRAGHLSVEGVRTDEGASKEALGGPLQALAWLAAHLGARGTEMPAGSIVMTGSLMLTRFPDGPGRWEFEVEGLGAVSMQIEA